MVTTASKPSIGQIKQARILIQNGWTHSCREERRREARARQDRLAQLLRQASPDASSKHRELHDKKTSHSA